jgi:molybdopterin biosynthesis enzyme
MIEISKALKIIKRETKPLGDESVRLSDAVGRILAEHILADTDMPPFDRSQMDGFAVRAKDTENAPVGLKIVGESAAGRGWHRKMKSGEAVRIMTGAPVPDGADSIQKIELTSEADGVITILEPNEVGK